MNLYLLITHLNRRPQYAGKTRVTRDKGSGDRVRGDKAKGREGKGRGDGVRGDKTTGRGGILSCLPCLSPCLGSEVDVGAHRKDETADEQRAHTKQTHCRRPEGRTSAPAGAQAARTLGGQQKTGSEGPQIFEQKSCKFGSGRGDVDSVCLNFGNCDSAAHLKAGWGDGVLGDEMLKIQSSMRYSDDEDAEVDGASERGAKCARSKRNVNAYCSPFHSCPRCFI